MRVSRRALFAQLAAASVLGWREARAQSGETVEYSYDVHGRVTRAEYSSGVVAEYEYDNAGNRIEVSRTGGATPPTPPVFSATINLSTATGPINLRTLANGEGYDGLRNATITFVVGSGATVTGPAGGADAGVAITTGSWPSASYAIALTLQVSGKVYGGGGTGGGGASDLGFPATAGSAGGDAVYAQENCTVVVNSGGEIKSGGGGGGGGGAWTLTVGGETQYWSGGSGGGGFPNGPAGDGASAGTTGGGGAGGPAGSMSFAGRANGAGGAGGNAGQAGASGAAATGTSFPNLDWGAQSAMAGGIAGYAIRKNGKTVSVTNNGTISGTVG